MKTSVFANEKKMQQMFNLKNRPERFTDKGCALRFAKSCTKAQFVVYLDENPAGLIPGYYVVYPCDYTRLEREAEGIFTYVPFYAI